MRLKKTVTKSNTTYCVIMDYTNLKGKRSTCVYEALGNEKNLQERFGNENTMDKVTSIRKIQNNSIKYFKILKIKFSKST